MNAMLRRAVVMLLMTSSLLVAAEWNHRLDLDRVLKDPQAFDSLVIAYTSYENKSSLYIFGNGKIVSQPTSATTELVPTCTADLTEEQVRGIVQLLIDKHFFDLPEKNFIVLDTTPDDAWKEVKLHTIRVTDDEGVAGRSFGTGDYNAEKQSMPSDFADIRDALIQLRDSSFPKGRTKPCHFETQIKK